MNTLWCIWKQFFITKFYNYWAALRIYMLSAAIFRNFNRHLTLYVYVCYWSIFFHLLWLYHYSLSTSFCGYRQLNPSTNEMFMKETWPNIAFVIGAIFHKIYISSKLIWHIFIRPWKIKYPQILMKLWYTRYLI